MPSTMRVTFLGTTSGGGPTETRNCSSLVLDAVGDGSLWKGTVRQFAQQEHPGHDARRLRMSRITKVFITHMHADHTMGLITVLRNILGMPTSWDHSHEPQPRTYKSPSVEIYGPAGLRSFVRTNFNLTHTRSSHHYCVHELLHLNETASVPCDPHDLMHSSEEVGKDIVADEDGFWRDLCEVPMQHGNKAVVDVGPIVHRDPCIGYVVREQTQLPRTQPDSLYGPRPAYIPRKIVILGDTSNPSAMIPLINHQAGDPVSLLIHEATDAWMPPHVDKYGTTGKNRTPQSVLEKTVEKGHSTPAMAGTFARMIGAERLVLNHIGARFPAPPLRPQTAGDRFRHSCMREFERQANITWQPPYGVSAIAAYDFFSIDIPPNQPKLPSSALEIEDREVAEAVEWMLGTRDPTLGIESSSGTTTVTHTHYEREEDVDSGTAQGRGPRKRPRKRNRDEHHSQNQSSQHRDHGREHQHHRRRHRHKSGPDGMNNQSSQGERSDLRPQT